MSMTAVPISIRLVRAPTAASSGNGDPSCRAKWCTRKYAPSAPSSSAATARSTDCSSASDADCVSEPGEDDQCPNDRNPIFFTRASTRARRAAFLAAGARARGRSAEERADGGGEGRRAVDPREVPGPGLDDDGRVAEDRRRGLHYGGCHHRVQLAPVQQDGRGELLQRGPGRGRVKDGAGEVALPRGLVALADPE